MRMGLYEAIKRLGLEAHDLFKPILCRIVIVFLGSASQPSLFAELSNIRILNSLSNGEASFGIMPEGSVCAKGLFST